MRKQLQRGIRVIAVVVLILHVQSYAHATDGGADRLYPEAADAGAPSTARRPTAPAGATLGPLPWSVGSAPSADSESERRYPLKRRADGVLVYQAQQFSAEVALDG